MPMQKSIPAASPDAYLASLQGWQRRYAEALHWAVLEAADVEARIKWRHIVYFANGPVLLVRAEPERVLFGFWRGQRLHSIESRLRPGGKYEMATLEVVESTPMERATVIRLVREAVALNARLGNPATTDAQSAAD